MAIFKTAKEEFTLADVRVEHARNPRTFLIPSPAHVEALKPGDTVKLIFVLCNPHRGQPQAERMWVKIKERNGMVFSGVLDNVPYYLKSIKAGDMLLFTGDHIAAIYGQTCPFDAQKFAIITQKALDCRQVNWAARSIELHDPQDSGWQLFYGDETPDYLEQPENSTLIKLADILRFEPLLERVFGEHGTAYEYKAQANAFIEVQG